MGIVVFGCKQSTVDLITHLELMTEMRLTLITVSKNVAERNHIAGYRDLRNYSLRGDVIVVDDYTLSSNLPDVLQTQQSIGFVMGWQRLIPSRVLNNFSVGVFGMHGSATNLPEGRGRSPLNWALIEGRKQFYTNLFKYNPGVDDGDILDTYKFSIGERDTIETLHFKNTLAMLSLIERNISQLLSGSPLGLIPQEAEGATYYPKRKLSDSFIDFSDDINSVERFIRAVTRPFGGARAQFLGREIIIYSAQVFDQTEFHYSREETGKIVHLFDNKMFLIKLKGGLLLVKDYEGEIELGGVFKLTPPNGVRFTRNKYGNFDIEE